MTEKLNVAILGTGKLGTDLLIKVLRSKILNCSAFVGRNEDSRGIALAKSLNILTSTQGVSYLESVEDSFDVVFDVTNAYSHLLHWPVIKKMGKKVIDLTPSHLGHIIIPAINLEDAHLHDNIGLVSCGGQAALPIIHVISKTCSEIQSIEVVSCIASKSAGPSTRINIDEYVQKTESAIQFFSGCPNVKAILILNPAEPEMCMKTTVYVESAHQNLVALQERLTEMVKIMKEYVPGYEISMGPAIDQGNIVVSTRVTGRGDFLPPYAGNLDIINCAAIQVAEALSIKKQSRLNSCLS